MQETFKKLFVELGAVVGPALERAVLEGIKRCEQGICNSIESAVASVRGELPWLFTGESPKPAASEAATPIKAEEVVQQPLLPTAEASISSPMAIEGVAIEAVRKDQPKAAPAKSREGQKSGK